MIMDSDFTILQLAGSRAWTRKQMSLKISLHTTMQVIIPLPVLIYGVYKANQ